MIYTIIPQFMTIHADIETHTPCQPVLLIPFLSHPAFQVGYIAASKDSPSPLLPHQPSSHPSNKEDVTISQPNIPSRHVRLRKGIRCFTAWLRSNNTNNYITRTIQRYALAMFQNVDYGKVWWASLGKEAPKDGATRNKTTHLSSISIAFDRHNTFKWSTVGTASQGWKCCSAKYNPHRSWGGPAPTRKGDLFYDKVIQHHKVVAYTEPLLRKKVLKVNSNSSSSKHREWGN